jgi:SAM-dependent methyltransferase
MTGSDQPQSFSTLFGTATTKFFLFFQGERQTNMIEEILTIAQASTYDFRKTAHPEDPLRHLFPEWVSYYRMKWAIAGVLQPKSILEIGVRFGYSALAFLNACPTARYVGIDTDSPTFGGSVGAINWARQACRQYQAEFVVADSTKMKRFPGERYDLVHIDGQQDGEGTMHDLVLAAAQTRYILVDGYFWSRPNFLSASEFVYRYRELIEFYEVSPGYAGELLIKMKTQDISMWQGADSSIALRAAYTKDYYLLDCGGYEAFKRTFGATLEDPRLEAVAKLAGAGPVNRALDLGCGRGELSLELVRRGFEVTAIDYSRDAIAIAREAISRNPDVSSSISLQCDDVNAVELQGQYGIAVAADLIEHMKWAELDRLYARTAKHLAEDGLFIVHTYPNLWYYKYGHQRRLKLARSVGAYLPAEPRSRYELLMHINEQSPRILKRQLSKYFQHVLVWFGSPAEPVANLKRRFSIGEICAAPDLFAVASHSPIQIAKLVSEFCMEPLSESDLKRLGLTVRSYPTGVPVGSRFTVSVELRNDASADLKSADPYPVHLSYHWLGTGGQYVTFGGERTRLLPDARRGSSMAYALNVVSPNTPGEYILRVTLVQERVRWFDQSPNQVYGEVQVSCLEARPKDASTGISDPESSTRALDGLRYRRDDSA